MYLNDTIFQLIGFKNDEYEEKVFEEYLTACMKVAIIDIFKYPEKLERMATGIYESLIEKQGLQNQKKRLKLIQQKKIKNPV